MSSPGAIDQKISWQDPPTTRVSPPPPPRPENARFPVKMHYSAAGYETEILALKHESRILGHSSNPVCGLSMMEQVRLCAVWPMENWLGFSLNHIQGWTIVREFYSRVLEQGSRVWDGLHSPTSPLPITIRSVNLVQQRRRCLKPLRGYFSLLWLLSCLHAPACHFRVGGNDTNSGMISCQQKVTLSIIDL